MGIKHFFYWFKQEFADHVRPVHFKPLDVHVDNLMVDMNGIIHASAQKIYRYGAHKEPARLLNEARRRLVRNTPHTQQRVYEDVCAAVEGLKQTVRPAKRIVLCIDGPAPISKQNQQRQRRFRSAREAETAEAVEGKCMDFDSNAITPGTRFMDGLSRYMDRYLRKRVREDASWAHVQVIFSSEKVPGEGEHKIVNYIRRYGDPRETYCINGMDADLIMLALGTHYPRFYILRDDAYGRGANDYFCIDIGAVRLGLSSKMDWRRTPRAQPSAHGEERAVEAREYCARQAIDDFIFMCFTVGNDFLPHIPSIEIIEDGLELLLDIYRTVGRVHGHLTVCTADGTTRFALQPLHAWLAAVGACERANLERKMAGAHKYYPDEQLRLCTTYAARDHGVSRDREACTVDIDRYIHVYCESIAPTLQEPQTPEASRLPMSPYMRRVCHDYLEGMQWVLSYYKTGVPDWTWCYTYHYAPPASVLARHVHTFAFPVYAASRPSTPFQQLLSVLPPRSACLIPQPLDRLLTQDRSPLKRYCPKDFQVDLAGKRKEWEGTVLLPMMDIRLVSRVYMANVGRVNDRDKARDRPGRSVVYRVVARDTGMDTSTVVTEPISI